MTRIFFLFFSFTNDGTHWKGWDPRQRKGALAFTAQETTSGKKKEIIEVWESSAGRQGDCEQRKQ